MTSSSADGFSINFIYLTKHISTCVWKCLPASISYYESPITIRFVMAALSSRPSISQRLMNAAFFHSPIYPGYYYSNSPLAEITGIYFIIILCTLGIRIKELYSTHPLLAFVIISTFETLKNYSNKLTI